MFLSGGTRHLLNLAKRRLTQLEQQAQRDHRLAEEKARRSWKQAAAAAAAAAADTREDERPDPHTMFRAVLQGLKRPKSPRASHVLADCSAAPHAPLTGGVTTPCVTLR